MHFALCALWSSGLLHVVNKAFGFIRGYIYHFFMAAAEFTLPPLENGNNAATLFAFEYLAFFSHNITPFI
jgi:hypothetical protein